MNNLKENELKRNKIYLSKYPITVQDMFSENDFNDTVKMLKKYGLLVYVSLFIIMINSFFALKNNNLVFLLILLIIILSILMFVLVKSMISTFNGGNKFLNYNAIYLIMTNKLKKSIPYNVNLIDLSKLKLTENTLTLNKTVYKEDSISRLDYDDEFIYMIFRPMRSQKKPLLFFSVRSDEKNIDNLLMFLNKIFNIKPKKVVLCSENILESRYKDYLFIFLHLSLILTFVVVMVIVATLLLGDT